MAVELSHIVKVGIADMDIVESPGSIRTSGLGSCVGVVIYDPNKEIAGLAHVMLPDSSLSKGKTINLAKYADTAVPGLLNLLLEAGAYPGFLKAKIAGGAQMFQFSSGNELLRIGPRNVQAVKQQLERLKIPIMSEDTGGNSGRTIEFNPKLGIMNIRTVNKGVTDI
ncbi:chemotaxis protein CheD [Peribacillus deserti]|uniref:Probable chemoreceptor glutamine deamidase CheD n=1 Tax=Peribacillus deserti TaxID=673318 RepID=A0ABS2QGF1_9BACI|nr:chemotaxis protein CheD [Peribacillus deserti]MBM7692241.1 chemotaxis protein CheD [Peribacillus deserti]